MNPRTARVRNTSLPLTKSSPKVEVTIMDGYVMIREVGVKGSPRFDNRIYITRSAWIKLLKWGIPITREMQGPDHHPYEAMKDYIDQESEMDAELKRQKREHHQRVGRSGTAKRKRRRR